MTKNVSIFGSYKPAGNDEEYKTAYEIAFRLSKAGFTIKNGGGSGIMEASTLGAKDAGGKSIGYILNTLNTNPDNFINDKIIKCTSLFDRLKGLIEDSSAFIIFSGGTGTLVELSLAWELMNKKQLNNFPIICYKNHWKPVIDIFKKNPYFIKEKSIDLIKFADSADEIINLILK